MSTKFTKTINEALSCIHLFMNHRSKKAHRPREKPERSLIHKMTMHYENGGRNGPHHSHVVEYLMHTHVRAIGDIHPVYKYNGTCRWCTVR